MPVRKTGLDVTVYTIGGTVYLGQLDSATLTINVDSEEAKGLADQWNFAWATGKGWSLESDTFIASAATTLVDAINGDALVTIAFTSGAGTYSGTGLIKTASHSVGNKQLQKEKFTIEGQGAITAA